MKWMLKTSRQSSRSKPGLITARWKGPAPVLVCRKCLKRADDGRELKRVLKSELKRIGAAQANCDAATAGRGNGKATKGARVVLTSCFGICPKRAVVLASSATLQRGEYLLVADSAAMADAAEILMPPRET